MTTISHSQIEELIARLPAKKLPTLYEFLVYLLKYEGDEGKISPVKFIRLPLKERRRLMKQQAAEMVAHYTLASDDRSEWQGGDFLDN
jgi:hypothetical protein